MILTIAGKELKAMFSAPLAWILLTLLQLGLTYFFLMRLDEFMANQPQFMQMPNPPGVTESVVSTTYFTFALLILPVLVPLLGMRLIAEERRNQTMVLLVSAPLSMTEIVLGKFVGLMGFLLLIIGIITLMPLALLAGGRLDFGLLLSVIAGVALLAACFSAVALYASCLTAQPFVAAIIAFLMLLGMVLAGGPAADGLRERGWTVPAALVQVLSPLKNFETFARGTLDSYSIACMVLLIAVFLILSVRRLDAARLRG